MRHGKSIQVAQPRTRTHAHTRTHIHTHKRTYVRIHITYCYMRARSKASVHGTSWAHSRIINSEFASILSAGLLILTALESEDFEKSCTRQIDSVLFIYSKRRCGPNCRLWQALVICACFGLREFKRRSYRLHWFIDIIRVNDSVGSSMQAHTHTRQASTRTQASAHKGPLLAC